MTALGDQLAGLEWTCDLDNDGHLIADALVICRFTDMESGESGVFLSQTTGSDAITTLGLIEAARQINSGDWHEDDE